MSVSFWEGRDLDVPYSVNGFKGTWAFSEHALIPECLRNFILEAFHPQEKFKRIPLEDINKLMNEVWEGPGSMVKIETLTAEMKNARRSETSGKEYKLEDVKTIDDFSEEAFQSGRFDDVREERDND